MSVRKVIFWLHLIAGVVAGLIILVLSATGLILSFERQITASADGIRVKAETGAKPFPMDELLAKVRSSHSNALPSAVALRADPTAPVAFSFGKEKTVFANPYNGELLGEGAKSTRKFFGTVTGLHRWLGADGEGKEVGKAITGAANLVFLFIVISGVVIWWPQKWTASSLKAITLFRGGLRGKARNWNWHNVIGFWSALPLFFIVVSGVVISYPWASDLVYRVTGTTPPPQQGGGKQMAKGGAGESGGKSDRAPKAAPELNWSHYNDMWAQAQGKVTDWNIITLRMPSSPEAPFAFTIDRGTGARPDLRSQLNVAPTGQVVSYEPYASQNLGRKARLWIRWIHTGEAGGLIGQLVAALASLGAVFLVWTGLMLTWKRFTGRKN